MRAALAVALCSGVLAAQSPGVSTAGPPGNPIRQGTPRFTITTSGFTAAQLPLQLNLEVSLNADFTSLWADTTVTGSGATIVIPRLLPQNVQIWWRTVVRTAQGSPFVENAIGPRSTSTWLSLVSPNSPTGNTLTTLRPTFRWAAVEIFPPVEPWRFTVEVARRADGLVVMSLNTTEDSATAFADLESNTSYTWSVTGTVGADETLRVTSASTFVIISASAPIATVMFQPFPNPFPTPLLERTCVWFDLKAQADVKLEVLDLRGNRVARIFPGRGFTTFPPGRYGRDVFGGESGCDQRFTWDGTDSRGRVVPAGVYLIVFSGGGVTTRKQVLFRGR
jgi:hypothetical protein